MEAVGAETQSRVPISDRPRRMTDRCPPWAKRDPVARAVKRLNRAVDDDHPASKRSHSLWRSTLELLVALSEPGASCSILTTGVMSDNEEGSKHESAIVWVDEARCVVADLLAQSTTTSRDEWMDDVEEGCRLLLSRRPMNP